MLWAACLIFQVSFPILLVINDLLIFDFSKLIIVQRCARTITARLPKQQITLNLQTEPVLPLEPLNELSNCYLHSIHQSIELSSQEPSAYPFQIAYSGS